MDKDKHKVLKAIGHVARAGVVAWLEVLAQEPQGTPAADPGRPNEGNARMDDASDLEFEVLYRGLAKRCHPDGATSAHERQRRGPLMQRVNGAYAARSLGDLRLIARELEGKAAPA